MPDILNEDVNVLKKQVLLHMLHGIYYDYQISEKKRLKTLNGKYLEINIEENNTINDVLFLPKDINAGNGIIQELESLMIPVPNVYERLYTLGDQYSIVQNYLKDFKC